MTDDDQGFIGLAILARDRCRVACQSAIQLLDDDRQAAVLLISVASDMLQAAAGHDKEAVDMVMNNLRMER